MQALTIADFLGVMLRGMPLFAQRGALAADRHHLSEAAELWNRPADDQSIFEDLHRLRIDGPARSLLHEAVRRAEAVYPPR
jgi:hypothetical protein